VLSRNTTMTTPQANEGCGRLPLNGTIPDMHTTTE
jgi:hypothetical protein